MRKPEPEPDDMILELLTADDPRAIKLLYETYYPRLFFHVRKFVQHDHDAATLLNDLLFSIWEKRHTLELNKPLLYYLYRSARNRVLNFLRDKGRAKEFPAPPEWLNLAAEASPSTAADHGLALEDVNTLWSIAERYMTHRVRQTFLFLRVENKTKEEIAAVMGITVNAVEKNISRAFRVIEEISKHYFGLLLAASPLLLY